MAQVWLGTDEVLRRAIAVKILHQHLADDETFVARFRHEAIAVARLSHPAIVSVYDTCSDDGVEAIVMELVRGRTLRQRLDEGPVDPWLAANIAAQVCGALSGGPRRRARAPRHQARQHPAVRGRPREGRRLRHRQGGRIRRPDPGGLVPWGRPSTSHPNRSRPGRSMAAPTSTASAWCSTRCCADGSRSRATPRRPPRSPGSTVTRSGPAW